MIFSHGSPTRLIQLLRDNEVDYYIIHWATEHRKFGNQREGEFSFTYVEFEVPIGYPSGWRSMYIKAREVGLRYTFGICLCTGNNRSWRICGVGREEGWLRMQSWGRRHLVCYSWSGTLDLTLSQSFIPSAHIYS